MTVAPACVAAAAVAGVNAVGVCVELACQARMHALEPALQVKGGNDGGGGGAGGELMAAAAAVAQERNDEVAPVAVKATRHCSSDGSARGSSGDGRGVLTELRQWANMVAAYASQPIVGACVSLAMLYLTVLSFRGVMVGW
jgi:Ferroportin1 (FPN1)